MTACLADQSSNTDTSSGISEGFEALRRDLADPGRRAGPGGHDFDILIVGSGYGGAIAASEFAGCISSGNPLRVGVLERGEEYPLGSFPESMSDLAGHVRVSVPGRQEPAGRRRGLFDFRLGGDASALVANGLGGGSLINAGVMLPPAPDVLADEQAWPAAMRIDGAPPMDKWLERARGLLVPHGPATPAFGSASPAAKTLQALSLHDRHCSYSEVSLSIAPSSSRTAAGIPLQECRKCGDCFTGCNHGAKQSLDTSLLAVAFRRGARLFTGATVLRLERQGSGGWVAEVVHTDEKLRARQGAPLRVSTRRVILAAGTLGSTEILLRSQTPDLRFSAMLGSRFSTNADSIAVAWGLPEESRPAADDGVAPRNRGVGPTISAMVDWRGAGVEDDRAGIVVQSLVIPAALRWLYGEATTTAAALQALFTPDTAEHLPGTTLDPLAVDEKAIAKSLAFALMGNDDAAGRLALRLDEGGDGAVEIRWPELRDHPVFARQVSALEMLARGSRKGISVLPNPVAAPWPAALGGKRSGAPLTVHPLGGCPMADDCTKGVVDHLGRVFNPSGLDTPIYDGLVVLDGAIVPRALGINPALTIGALALRACEGLRKAWGLDDPPDMAACLLARPSLPGYPLLTDAQPAEKHPTQAVLRERLSGPVGPLEPRSGKSRYIVELTICTEPFELANTFGPALREGRTLNLRGGEDGSMLRVFLRSHWSSIERPRRGADVDRSGNDHETRLDEAALLKLPLSGTIELLDRGASTRRSRTLRALWAYVRNRGTRDLWGRIATLPRAIQAIPAIFALASRAGEVRTLRYELNLGTRPLQKPRGIARHWIKDRADSAIGVTGYKRLTYARRANPWRQLSRLEFPPCTWPAPGERPLVVPATTLELDLRYLARRGHPLLRITGAQDHPTALADLASLAMYWARLLIGIHFWSFRAPDPPEPGTPNTRVRRLPGIPRPQAHEIPLETKADGSPVIARLTRYRRSDSLRPPVLLIHGYSTSGTTFAHPDIDPCLASWLWNAGRDVWVADLRTSIAMNTAMAPWRFEDVALVDLPEILAHIREQSRAEQGAPRKIDVVAHCMGAAMLSMAILREPPDPPYPAASGLDEPPCSARLARIRRDLPAWLNKVVLTQVGPVVAFAPANVLRAYLMRWLRHYLPAGEYRFRIEGEPSASDALLDRLLSTLPYPDEEHDLENPSWLTPWRTARFAATRHRMDALYGRDFSLATMDARALARIDDIFGPPNLETVAQTLHFARNRMITDRAGRGGYLDGERLARRWTFDTLYLHSENNGLSDPATLALMEARFADEGLPLTTRWLEGVGHQDSLIGREAYKTFQAITSWLGHDGAGNAADGDTVRGATGSGSGRSTPEEDSPPLSVRVPSFGPLLAGQDNAMRDQLRLGTDPALGVPLLAWLVPVRRCGNRFCQQGQCLQSPLRPTGNGWYRIEAPAADAEGWLVLIAHSHPDWVQRIFGDDADPEKVFTLTTLQEAFASGFAAHVLAADGRKQWGMLVRRVEEQVDALLARPASALEAAFVSNDILPTPYTKATAKDQDAADADARHAFSLAVASCQYPPGILDGELSQRSLERMAGLIDSSGSEAAPVRALLLLGDQIYADATAGLFDPLRADERHSAPYRELLESAALRRVLRRVPAFAMLDDHEIQDDWEPTAPDGYSDAAGEAALADGTAAYRSVFGQTNSLPATPGRDRNKAPDAGRSMRPRLWYESEIGGHPVFMLDTRTRRQHRDPSRIEHASLLDPNGETEQVDALEAWLLATRRHPGPRFVASPAMLLPRRRLVAKGEQRSGAPASAIRSDAWDGYPGSLHRLLGFIAHSRQQRLVFLSGDEHLSCVARIALSTGKSGRPTVVHSVHSSALYAPWPFANSRPVDFAARETFPLRYYTSPTGPTTVCRIRTRFAAFGAGFARLRFEPDERRSNHRWRMTCEFFDCAAADPDNSTVTVRAALGW